MNFSKSVKDIIKDYSVEDKLKFLKSLEMSILNIRAEVLDEWTYCAGCHEYVRYDERVKKISGDKAWACCGNCGCVHETWKE